MLTLKCLQQLSCVGKELLLGVLTLMLTSFVRGVWSSHHVIHSNLRSRLNRVVVINIRAGWSRV